MTRILKLQQLPNRLGLKLVGVREAKQFTLSRPGTTPEIKDLDPALEVPIGEVGAVIEELKKGGISAKIPDTNVLIRLATLSRTHKEVPGIRGVKYPAGFTMHVQPVDRAVTRFFHDFGVFAVTEPNGTVKGYSIAEPNREMRKVALILELID